MEIDSKVINYKDQMSLTWMLWPRAALVINRIFITFLSASWHVLNYWRLHKLQHRSIVQLDSSNLFPLFHFNTVAQLLLQNKTCYLLVLYTIWSKPFNFCMSMANDLKIFHIIIEWNTFSIVFFSWFTLPFCIS